MGLVDYHKKVLWEIVEQRIWRLTRLAAVKIAGVVLYTLTVAYLTHHLHIVCSALLYALCLYQLILRLKLLYPDLHVMFYLSKGLDELIPARGVMGGGEYCHMAPVQKYLAGSTVYFAYALHLVAEELDAQHLIRPVGGKHLQHVPLCPEGAPDKVVFVALVLYINQPPHYLIPVYLHALAQGYGEFKVFRRVSQSVYTAYGSHDYNVPALVQGAGSAVAQLIYLVVYCGYFFYICIRRGYVRLRLVVVIVRDEILYRAVREELPQLAAKLRCKGLVMGDDKSRLLHLLYHLRHGEGLAAAGDAQKHLKPVPPLYALAQGGYSLGLVALRLKGGYYFELSHADTLNSRKKSILEIHGYAVYQHLMDILLYLYMLRMVGVNRQILAVRKLCDKRQIIAPAAAHEVGAGFHADKAGNLAYQALEHWGYLLCFFSVGVLVANDMSYHGFILLR